MNNQNTQKFSQRKEFLRTGKATLRLLQSFVILLCILIISYLFIFTPARVKNSSMSPTLSDGELLLANKLVNWLDNTDIGKGLGLEYKRGDIIIFQKPGQDYSVKRIIGMEGDRIAIRDGYVYINNQRLIEEYLNPATFTRGSDFIEDNGESKVVGKNELFVLGDNRSNSLDSKNSEVGFIKKDWLKGRIMIVYWPLSNIKLIHSENNK
jgi:signal peptidase I